MRDCNQWSSRFWQHILSFLNRGLSTLAVSRKGPHRKGYWNIEQYSSFTPHQVYHSHSNSASLWNTPATHHVPPHLCRPTTTSRTTRLHFHGLDADRESPPDKWTDVAHQGTVSVTDTLTQARTGGLAGYSLLDPRATANIRYRPQEKWQTVGQSFLGVSSTTIRNRSLVFWSLGLELPSAGGEWHGRQRRVGWEGTETDIRDPVHPKSCLWSPTDIW